MMKVDGNMALPEAKKIASLTVFPGFDDDEEISLHGPEVCSTSSYAQHNNCIPVYSPLKRVSKPIDYESQAASPSLQFHKLEKSKHLEVLSTPTNLASTVQPFGNRSDLPPAMPTLSDLQKREDFLRPSLQSKTTYICRPSLLPRAEIKRSENKKRMQPYRRALILESCSLLAEEDDLTEIREKIADCQIDLPNLSDDIDLRDRFQQLKPRRKL